jgi:DedD protein
MENEELLNIKEKPKKNLKKPLVYGALFFLIFIVGVVVYALYSNSQNSKENVILPPQVNSEDNSNFKNLPVEETDNQIEDIKPSIEDNNSEILEVSANDSNSNLKKSKNKQDDRQIIINSDKKNRESLLNEKNNNETKKVKQNIEKNNENIKIKQVKKENISKKYKYYIQVAALVKYKKPNEKFLSLIKKERFNYTFYNTSLKRGGKEVIITKILIGPFKNKEEAKKKLKIVKEKITQNAFIFKVRE